MIILNPYNHDVDRETLISFVDYLSNTPGIRNYMVPYVKEFREIWNSHLRSGKLCVFSIPYNNCDNELFPLEHTMGEYFTVSTFSIDSINMLIKTNQIHIDFLPLSFIVSSLHFTFMNERSSCFNRPDKPVIAVLMPSKAEQTTFYSIIDGNHRVSAAIKQRENIPIACIKDLFLPPVSFATGDDWIVFHIIQGFSLLAGEIIEPKTYIITLKDHLNTFLPT